MRKLVLCLVTSLLLSSNAYAGMCENALRGAQKKAITAKSKCEDNSAVDKLRDRLAKSKAAKTKAAVQKLINKAVARQATYCAKADAQNATVKKINNFCQIAASTSTTYCRFGYSLRVKGDEASSHCKRGRFWFPGENGAPGKCYYEEEYYYTSAADFGYGKTTGRGEILYSGQPEGYQFYQINIGFLLSGVTKPGDCK